MNSEIRSGLMKFAASDLKYARTGAMTVAQTKLGNLDITYDGKNYHITTSIGKVFEGKSANAKEFLVNNYMITYE